LIDSNVAIIRLDTDEYEQLLANRQQFTLNFDDAYQLTLCQKYDLLLVSYDADFDKTDTGKRTPEEILKNL